MCILGCTNGEAAAVQAVEAYGGEWFIATLIPNLGAGYGYKVKAGKSPQRQWHS